MLNGIMISRVHVYGQLCFGVRIAAGRSRACLGPQPCREAPRAVAGAQCRLSSLVTARWQRTVQLCNVYQQPVRLGALYILVSYRPLAQLVSS